MNTEDARRAIVPKIIHKTVKKQAGIVDSNHNINEKSRAINNKNKQAKEVFKYATGLSRLLKELASLYFHNSQQMTSMTINDIKIRAIPEAVER